MTKKEEFGRWTWKDKKPTSIIGDSVLVDIDGVLSDASNRQHFLKKTGERDWQGFFAACTQDLPFPKMVELLNWLDPKLTVVLLTARPHWIYEETVEWLNKNFVRWDLLVMRNEVEKDFSAKDYKVEALESLHQAGFNFIIAFEDDPQNVEALDIPCVYVHSGYYEKDSFSSDSNDPPVY